MKSVIELGIVIAVVALAMSFLALRLIKTLRGKQTGCCSCAGGKKPCPHCGDKNPKKTYA